MTFGCTGTLQGFALISACLLLPGTVFAGPAERISGSIEGQPTEGRPTVVLRGNVAREIAGARDEGPLAPWTKISGVRLVLKPSPAQTEELERLLEDQRNPGSPDYQNWLTPEEFGERFGVSENDIGKLSAWLRAQGFSVDQVARARNWIVISGTASQIGAAFRTGLRSYVVGGERHFANASEPSVPASLEGVVGEIRGLDDFRPKPFRIRAIRPDYTAPSGAHYLAPDDLAAIYDIAPLYQAGIDGTGQKLVIPGQTDINLADIRAFRSHFGLPARDPQLVLTGKDPGVSQGDEIESELDLEWSGAVARNATIIFVYSQNVFESVQYAIDENLAPVISLSYGACEQGISTSYRSMAQQANAEGITWLSASGDSAAAGCDDQGSSAAKYGPAVTFPADIPEVTAVGGTEFNETGPAGWSAQNGPTSASATGYLPEKAWNDTALGDGIEGSGGGASAVYAKPWWQSGPGVPADNARDVPDVALSASGAHDGYMMYANGSLMAVGGTSASTPSFAGIVSLLNQYLVAKGVQAKAGAGNINPNLYSLAQNATGVFHDITVGDNIVPCKAGSIGCPASGSFGYKAGPGYDLVTGLGSVDANVLVTKWASLPAGAGTTTAVTATPASIGTTGTVQVTAKVTAVSGSNPPAGSVAFSAGSVSLGSATLSAGVATVSVKGSSLAVGANTITAAYTASGNFSSSSGTAIVTVTSAALATSISASANPASIAATGTTQITVTVKAASGTAAPTGSVALSVGSASLGSAALSSAGVATFSVKGSSLAAGANTITAAYTASGNFGNSSGTVSVTVTTPVAATTALVAAAPSSIATTGTTQITVTVKAASGTAAPTGNVTLSAGSASLGSAALSSAGVATFSVKGSSLTVGANTITATFTASGNFGSSSGTVGVTVTSTAIATTTSLSASSATIATSGSTEITVTVKAASGTAAPTGSVTLSAGSASLGSAALSSGGVATFPVKGSSLAVGANTLTAAFNATGNFSSSSGTVSVMVTTPAASTTTLVAATPSSIATTGTTQITVTVKATSGTAAPTGSVTLSAGSVSLGSAALSSGGVATFPVKGSSLAVGANTLTAAFNATGNFGNSSGTVGVMVTTPAASTTTLVAATPSSIATTGTTQITVTVKAASGMAAPTGSVALSAGSASLGSAALSSAGTATFPVKGSSLTVGANTLTATFNASGNFGSSSGATSVTVTVAPAGSSVAVTVTPTTSSQPGWPVTVHLQEQAGVATKVTGFTINGTDFSSLIAAAFGSAQLPAHGTLTANLIIQWKSLPASVAFAFTGVDPGGRQWAQSATAKTSGN